MAFEHQKLNDDKDEPQRNRAWFHLRRRTVVLLLLGIALGGWFVRLMIQADNNPFDDSLTWMVLCLLTAWANVYGYCMRYSRCPSCGKYALGEEGIYFINFLKRIFSLSGEPGHWDLCRNCGYQEWQEGGPVD